MHFDVKAYENQVIQTTDFLRKKLPKSFIPKLILTLGSGGFGEVSNIINKVVFSISYSKIPGFTRTTIAGHEGKLIFGYISKIPVMILKGRIHYHEIGPQPDQISALKQVTFPVYVGYRLGAKIYFATNAAGGLNLKYKTGDVMIIKSHVSLFYPNPLLGPTVFNSMRFVPQNNQYEKPLRKVLLESAKKINEIGHIHEGVYSGMTGTTYESSAESIMLRKLGVDAVGMSTVPEIIVATSLGMKTVGLSLITNVITKDGTNATSHEEVMRALENIKTKKRILNLFIYFFQLSSTDSI